MRNHSTRPWWPQASSPRKLESNHKTPSSILSYSYRGASDGWMKYSAHRARSETKYRRGTVIFGANLSNKYLDSSGSRLFGAALFGALFILALCPISFGQSPNPAASGLARDNPGGFTPGLTLGATFEGSYSSDGSVYDIGSAVGYNFSRHFGVDAGVPFYFTSAPSTIKNNNTGAVSGIGVGALFTDLRLNYPNPSLSFSSALHLTAPTGDTKKVLSTGHAPWTVANHFDHAFEYFSPSLYSDLCNPSMTTLFSPPPFTPFDHHP